MDRETNGFDEWQKYSPHILLNELKRLNENIENLREADIITREMLTRHDVFIEEAKDKDIIQQISDNSKFRTNTKKLMWKLTGTAIGSAGGITALVNWIATLLDKSGPIP